MRNTRTTIPDDDGSGFGLIFGGLLLAMLGAASIMLMVVGASCLYVGRYGYAAGLLAGFVAGGVVFFKTYGRYLTRLEARAPMEPHHPSVELDEDRSRLQSSSPRSAEARDRGQPPGPRPQTSGASPLPTNVVIALATGGYGLLIITGGLIWTRGQALSLNVIAGAALLVCAGLAWWFGRSTGQRDG